MTYKIEKVDITNLSLYRIMLEEVVVFFKMLHPVVEIWNITPGFLMSNQVSLYRTSYSQIPINLFFFFKKRDYIKAPLHMNSLYFLAASFMVAR